MLLYTNQQTEKEVKILLASPSYKRPFVAQRMILSVKNNCPCVDMFLILAMPENLDCECFNMKNVNIIKSKQLSTPNARNVLMDNACKYNDWDILWLTDDDMIAIPETIINSGLISLVMNPFTGVVSISRNIHGIKKENTNILEPFPYIGGGWLMRRKIAEKYRADNDGGDELSFTSKIYLNGYENYRTKSCWAIHKQGSGDGGGLSEILKEQCENKKVEVPNDTVFNENNDLIKSTPMKGRYHGKYVTWYQSGTVKRITKKGKELHSLMKNKIIEENNVNKIR